MSFWNVVGLLAFAIAVPLLLVWRLTSSAGRVEDSAGASGDDSAFPAGYRVPVSTWVFLVGFWFVFVTAFLVGAVTNGRDGLLLLSLAALYYVHAAYFHLVFLRHTFPASSEFLLRPSEWRRLCAGAMVAGFLAVSSALLNDTVAGWIVGFFNFWIAYALWLAAKRAAGAGD